MWIETLINATMLLAMLYVFIYRPFIGVVDGVEARFMW
jgi:hypothetical protein